MDEIEQAIQAKIDGYEIVVGVFLNAPLRREEFRERFGELEDEARRRNMHSETIAVLRMMRERLSDED